jgi:hypothetical protein
MADLLATVPGVRIADTIDQKDENSSRRPCFNRNHALRKGAVRQINQEANFSRRCGTKYLVAGQRALDRMSRFDLTSWQQRREEIPNRRSRAGTVDEVL